MAVATVVESRPEGNDFATVLRFEDDSERLFIHDSLPALQQQAAAWLARVEKPKSLLTLGTPIDCTPGAKPQEPVDPGPPREATDEEIQRAIYRGSRGVLLRARMQEELGLIDPEPDRTESCRTTCNELLVRYPQFGDLT